MKTVSLLEVIYRRRVEFLKRGLEPDTIIVPMDKKHQLVGECVDRFPGYISEVNDLHVYGMTVVWTDPIYCPEILVALSSDGLK